MQSNTYVVINEKGGVGRSIISKFVLPTVFYKPGIKINVYEIDDFNPTDSFSSKLINYNLFKINEQNDAIFDIAFNKDDVNTISIVDVGGGDDVLAVLKALAKNKITNPSFIIPTYADIDHFQNISNTIAKIKTYYGNPKITLVLNKVHDIHKSKKQFTNLFGSKKFGLKANLQSIEKDIQSMCIIPDTPLLLLLKNKYKMSLLDMYIDVKDLVKNKHTHESLWKEKDDNSFYEEKMLHLNFAIKIVKFVKIIKKSFSDL